MRRIQKSRKPSQTLIPLIYITIQGPDLLSLLSFQMKMAQRTRLERLKSFRLTIKCSLYLPWTIIRFCKGQVRLVLTHHLIGLENPLNARSKSELYLALQEREKHRIETLSHIGKVPLMFTSPTFSKSLREMHELSESPRRHRLFLEHALSKHTRNTKLPVVRAATEVNPSKSTLPQIPPRVDSEENYHTPSF